jgi:hypothetical protein
MFSGFNGRCGTHNDTSAPMLIVQDEHTIPQIFICTVCI